MLIKNQTVLVFVLYDIQKQTTVTPSVQTNLFIKKNWTGIHSYNICHNLLWKSTLNSITSLILKDDKEKLKQWIDLLNASVVN